MRYLVLLLISLMAISHLAKAEIFFGSNFISKHPVINNFGGSSSSTNFQEQNSGGETIIGESTSTNFILRSGFLYFDTFNPRSGNWRWFGDEANETPTLPLADLNTAPIDIDLGDPLVLRLTIKEVANIGSKNIKYKLQFSKNSNFSTDVFDIAEISNCLTTSTWCYADGAGMDNALITTKLLSDAQACSSGNGPGCGAHNESGVTTSTFNHGRHQAAEFAFTIDAHDAEMNTTYFFRAFDVTHKRPVPAMTGASFPSLSIAGAKLSFSISGLPSNTTTEGVTTTVTTTPTSIPFGQLTFNTPDLSAHRLTVTSNAFFGYRIFIFEPQELNDGTETITPFLGTNETPLPWGIQNGSPSAYGYHAGDNTLSGNGGRFVADDSYAKLENVPKEIAYSPIPVTNEVTDLIFRLEINEEQMPGNYTGAVKYIVVPAF